MIKPDIKNMILYEDAQIIVCRKPAGIPVQTDRIGTPDLASLLRNHLSCAAPGSRGKSGVPYLAVIHRLDQPVEGLLVFAKTPQAARNLNSQLTSSGFGKYYLALSDSAPVPQEGVLENYMIKDSRTNTSRVCCRETPGAKPARLHYRIKEDAGTSCLIEIQLDTGRHHQIRVQMAHIGCPLIGDRKYGDKKSTEPLRLCAYRLEFKHPRTGKRMQFELSDVFS